MHPAILPQVCELEKTAYSHPWTQGNFEDSLRSGYWAQVLVGDALDLLGYVVAMPGVDETHLLNLTVAPAHQGRGWGRHLLDSLVAWSRDQGATRLWLEVRASNARARRLYMAYGFTHMGERKNYYPGLGRQREHAVVMSLALA
ncbi:MAG: ribosomal protein S18-alanine N-acetyltransferase [Alphaproteobacteria bacterium]|nr:ribosomal protein S18-alanine N-acetyltransferase [Alphaproteobacteria bacterium]